MASRRRGRPRKTGVQREPNGRPKRGKAAERESAEQATAVVAEARQRRYGLSPGQARSTEAGSMLGVAYLKGIITRAEYVAGLVFLQARDSYMRHGIDAPDYPHERPAGLIIPLSDEERARLSNRSRGQWDSLRRAVPDPRAMRALELVLVEDRYLPEFETALRRGLSAIHRHVAPARVLLPAEEAAALEAERHRQRVAARKGTADEAV